MIKDGYHGDTSRMFYVGEPVDPGAPAVRRDLRMHVAAASRRCSPARTWATSARRSRAHAEQHGYSVVREFCGHGIGRKFHEEPQVLHYGTAGTGLSCRRA